MTDSLIWDIIDAIVNGEGFDRLRELGADPDFALAWYELARTNKEFNEKQARAVAVSYAIGQHTALSSRAIYDAIEGGG